MSQAASLQRLTDRLLRIEEEIRTVRDDLETLHRQETRTIEAAIQPVVDSALPRVDEASLKLWADDFFTTLRVEGRALPAEALQQMIRASSLAPDELSRSLIAARDE